MKKITKRILTTMLAVIMLIGAIPAVMSYANENDIFSLDFEDETIGAEVTNTAVATSNLDASNTVTVEADPLNPNNKVLKITRNNTKKKPTALITFPAQSTAFTIEYRIIFNTTNQCAAVVKGGSLQGAYLVASRSGDGSNGLENNADAKNWANLFPAAEHDLNGWYNVKIDIDIAAYTYNITVTNANGVTKTNNGAALRNDGITSLNSLEIQFGGATATGNLYIDDIRVYDSTQAPVDPEPEQPPVDPTPDPEPEDPTPETPEDTTALQAAINKVASDLTAAQTALNTAITNGDKALDAKITALTGALDAAKKAYADADTAMKNSLSSKIEAADTTLDTAIKAVQKNLDDAITALGAADKTNADAIANAITDLNDAIDAAEAAATAADTALKNEINTKIDAADEALQTAIDALTTELQSVKQALENKDKELDDKIKALENKNADPTTDNETVDPIVIASIVISCVSVCGCVAIAALYVIDKKKKA